ncbi:MAG: dihydroneopterin aldolase [Bryobacteraceae bacterium]
MDKVILHGARLEARIGVTEEERSQPQELVVDVEMDVDVREAARTDDLRFAVDYAEAWRVIDGLAKQQPYALVETLAERIAAALLEKFPVQSARVLVRKPGALRAAGVEWVGVEVERRRGG